MKNWVTKNPPAFLRLLQHDSLHLIYPGNPPSDRDFSGAGVDVRLSNCRSGVGDDVIWCFSDFVKAGEVGLFLQEIRVLRDKPGFSL